MNNLKSMVKLFTIGLIFCSSFVFAQEPNWKWCKSATGIAKDEATAIAVDVTGNVYVAGNFKSTSFKFGTLTLNNLNPTATEIFLAKYNSLGTILWAKSIGNLGLEEVNDICIDAAGNIYLTGFFQSDTINFGNGVIITNSSIFEEIFVAKFTNDGVIVWAQSAQGSTKDIATGVAVDASGNVFISGYFESDSVIFNKSPLAQIKRVGTSDVFIAKYNSSGVFQWVKSAGGVQDDQSLGIAVDNSGNAIITGFFMSADITFGTKQLSNFSVSNSDMFLAKYNTNGDVLWAKIVTGEYAEQGNAVTTDGHGNIYVCGGFSSDNINFSSLFPLANSSPGSFYDDIFIVKYNSSGIAQWSNAAGGNMSDYAKSIAIDATGNCYVTGSFGSPTMIVGSTSLINSDSKGLGEIFAIKYNPTGGLIKALSAKSLGDDDSRSIAAYGNNAYIAGTFKAQKIDFGTYSIANSGDYDMIIAALGFGVSINDANFDNHFSVYPNPVHDKFSLSATGNALGKYNCKIYDVTGKVISESNIDFKSNSVHKFSTPSGYKGLILLHLTSENGKMFTRSIICN